jgi:hypothetical protein
MPDDTFLVANAYLEHLSDEDLRLLAAEVPEVRRGADPVRFVREHPDLVEGLISRSDAFETVFAPTRPEDGLIAISPFLVFAAAVGRTANELANANYVSEWLGPKRRTPVFDVAGLREFLASPWHRLFLAELLSSYTHVHSGSVLVRSRRGIRRQRFSELDPVRLAGVLEAVPDAERPGIYRRLGDLALFLTGVFPDHTATHGWSEIDRGRLLHSGRLDNATRRPSEVIAGFGDTSAVDLLEQLGRRWYKIAYDLVPPPVPAAIVIAGDLADRFGHARRILNVVTDRYLFPFRSELFGIGGA